MSPLDAVQTLINLPPASLIYKSNQEWKSGHESDSELSATEWEAGLGSISCPFIADMAEGRWLRHWRLGGSE
jgi:hypothetical protein